MELFLALKISKSLNHEDENMKWEHDKENSEYLLYIGDVEVGYILDRHSYAPDLAKRYFGRCVIASSNLYRNSYSTLSNAKRGIERAVRRAQKS